MCIRSTRVSYNGNTTGFQPVAGGSIPPTRSTKMSAKIYPTLRRIKQKPYCCVPACIQIILRYQGLPLISQQQLGEALGLVTPPAPRPLAGYGTRLQLARYEPNKIFRQLCIPLRWTWQFIDQIKTPAQLKKIMAKSLPEQNILVCFDWPTLFDPNNSQHWGHVCVLEKIDLQDNTVRLIDPDPSAPSRRTVALKNLLEAMKMHGEKNLAGIWVLELRSK